MTKTKLSSILDMPKLVFVIHVCKKSLIINQDLWPTMPHIVLMLRQITGNEVLAEFYKVNTGVCWTL